MTDHLTPSERALREAAEKATKGEWRQHGVDDTLVMVAGQRLPVYAANSGGGQAEQDAAYIVAAQPRAVLALLDEIERLRGALASANHLCRSALSIAERHGDDTNWWAFTANLKTELLRQHAVLWPTAALNPKEATDA